MTTIAYMGDILAADTQAQDGNGLLSEATKIHVADFLTGGSYVYRARLCVACAGRRDDGIRLFWHLRAACRDVEFSTARKVVETLQFDKDLDIDVQNEESSFMVALTGIPTWSGSPTKPMIVLKRIGRVMDPIGQRGYHAIGSGRDYALMAMRLGMPPKQAVMLTHEFDAHTGPGVQEVSVWPD